MRLADFDYTLPEDLIAQDPLDRRDASRLMVVDRATRDVRHARFTDLVDLLEPGDRLVLNDTRVVPSRLFGVREGHTGKVELLLVDPTRSRDAGPGPELEAITRPARKLSPGTRLRMGKSEAPVEIVAAGEEGRRRVRFPPGFDVPAFLEREGHLPLPPYIHRADGPADRERYQTVYAREQGAIAAPTAGLHFTTRMLEALGERGIERSTVTLHVGPGTFVPVTVEDPATHRMESEFCRVSAATAGEINATSRVGRRVVAVGTTVVRTLESLAVGAEVEGWTESGSSSLLAASPSASPESPAIFLAPPGGSPRIRAGSTHTRAFIHPPFRFRCVDALITNFHLPKSTLLMLVSAFAGLDLVREAYAEAVRERYRFYSYGDAMLIL